MAVVLVTIGLRPVSSTFKILGFVTKNWSTLSIAVSVATAYI
jgi:hypothetical protein